MKKSIEKSNFEIVVIGCSAGGLKALHQLLPPIPKESSLAYIVVQHRSDDSDNYLSRSLKEVCQLQVTEVEDSEEILAGSVYIAPANYHLLVERDRTLSLCTGTPENFSRPSIDVLFTSAATALGDKVIGVILTGGNKDGSAGLKAIQEAGGLILVQDPKTAEVPFMPQAAMDIVHVDHLLSIEELCMFLQEIDNTKES